MFDRIDPRSPTPLYAQISTRLRMAIAAGELSPRRRAAVGAAARVAASDQPGDGRSGLSRPRERRARRDPTGRRHVRARAFPADRRDYGAGDRSASPRARHARRSRPARNLGERNCVQAVDDELNGRKDVVTFAIETRDLYFRPGRGFEISNLNMHVPAGIAVRLSRPERRGKDDDDSPAPRPDPAGQAARSTCSATRCRRTRRRDVANRLRAGAPAPVSHADGRRDASPSLGVPRALGRALGGRAHADSSISSATVASRRCPRARPAS